MLVLWVIGTLENTATAPVASCLASYQYLVAWKGLIAQAALAAAAAEHGALAAAWASAGLSAAALMSVVASAAVHPTDADWIAIEANFRSLAASKTNSRTLLLADAAAPAADFRTLQDRPMFQIAAGNLAVGVVESQPGCW